LPYADDFSPPLLVGALVAFVDFVDFVCRLVEEAEERLDDIVCAAPFGSGY